MVDLKLLLLPFLISMVYSMPSPNDEEYNKWLEDCSRFDEMPYFNESSGTYDCFLTLSVGPCQPKQWFVLDKANPRQAICVEQKCACHTPKPEYQYDYGYEEESEADKENECLINIEEEGYLYLDFNGKCVESQESKESCPFGQWLVPNAFGEAECFCADNYLPYYDDQGVLKTCYQEFLRGPCNEGEQYNTTEGEFGFEGKCVPTNCNDKNQIRYKETCVTTPTDCTEKQSVKLPSKDHPEASCIDGLPLTERSGIISGSKSCGAGKKKDSKGRCKKTIGSKNKKGKRSPGTKGRGDVRKVCCG